MNDFPNSADIDIFLASAGYGEWTKTMLPGDASSRRYIRLTKGQQKSALLMVSGQEHINSFRAFLRISDTLQKAALCAPEIYAIDEALGLMLIEDLGKINFSDHISANPHQEALLYETALEVLSKVRSTPPNGSLDQLTPDRGAQMLEPFFQWFTTAVSDVQKNEIIGSVRSALAASASQSGALALRDFHAENLLWRPKQTGTNRVGIIDFQDAFIAPAEYDLVSLLQDARRLVSPSVQKEMKRLFSQQTGSSLDRVEAACAIIGIQRNLRILGIFQRLAQIEKNRATLPSSHGF